MDAHDLVRRQEESYSFLRFVADTLTILRFATAAFIVCLGLFVGPHALRAAIIATFFGWITDSFDGPIARSSGGRQSWVARVDFAADMALAYSFFLFVVVTGLFPIIPALVLVAAGATIVLLRPTESVVQIVTAPISALPVVLSFRAGLIVGICYFSFLALLVVFRWDHLVADARQARAEASRIADQEE